MATKKKINVVKQHNDLIKLIEAEAAKAEKIKESGDYDGSEFHPMDDPQTELAEAIVKLMNSYNLTIDHITDAIDQADKDSSQEKILDAQ